MPPLTPVVDTLETVPEAVRPFYEPKDGKFHLTLSAAPAGFVPAADLAAANGKVVEFRDNNVLLKKTVDELTPLKDRFKDIDPDAAREALAQVAKLNKKGVKDVDTDISKLITDAVAASNKPLQDALTAITKANEDNQKRADDMTLRSAIGDKFIKAGGRPETLDFMLSRAKGLFVVADGVVKAAPNQFSADKPGEPLTVEEWLTRQTKEAECAFKPSGGGGADPARGQLGGTPRAGVTVIKDPTPQQLGEYAKDVKAGKVRFEYTQQNA